jgi:hypothetical protein
MVQVWLVLTALFLEFFSRDINNQKTREVCRMIALGLVITSFVLVFINGGTTG